MIALGLHFGLNIESALEKKPNKLGLMMQKHFNGKNFFKDMILRIIALNQRKWQKIELCFINSGVFISAKYSAY